MCDLETSWMRRSQPALGRSTIRTKLQYLTLLRRWIIGEVTTTLRTQGQWQCIVSALRKNISLPLTLVWRHLTTFIVEGITGMYKALYYFRYKKMCGEIRNACRILVWSPTVKRYFQIICNTRLLTLRQFPNPRNYPLSAVRVCTFSVPTYVRSDRILHWHPQDMLWPGDQTSY
jgi:hypothetical protein